ncbi:alpha-glucuronidase family glycosyl hydrolase [Sporosarcina sp. NPDC096371]|uniref:alpha-glucuronidase family glycosyl hydrolase n=1 Tax=Sporosarcina sp. NPDC096371 TaxID=3364530 RepID=UPI0037FE6EEB
MIIIDKIIYWDTHETILFAVEELTRLMRAAGCESKIGDQVAYTETTENHNRIILITTNGYHASVDMKKTITVNDDGFAFVRSDKDLWIIGNEVRSILYGVYMYCRQRFGYQWIQLDKETIVKPKSPMTDKLNVHEPLFARRGNIIETINDPDYILSLIDWGVKNGQNEYFFTFFLWDDIKSYVTPALRKRGVHVTLGGHSLSYLLKEIQKDTNGDMLKKDEKLKFFAENTYLQEKVIDKIVAICLENKVITRISLWPEDIGIDEKNASGFLPTYIRFTEKLKSALHKEELAVEVEYIVYNAGLSWNMLERENQTKASDQVDVLYAYWGRDYSSAIDGKEPRQERAYVALQDWSKETEKKRKSLTVIEYYSDHFMLSELFPPLLMRIQQDLHDYKQLPINGVLNLIVPPHPKQPDRMVNYPWKWIHHLNNYMYTRISWGEEYEVIAEEYFAIFNDHNVAFYEMILELERLVSLHTKWNAQLFPARVIDPEKIQESVHAKVICTFLDTVYERLNKWELAGIEPLLEIQMKEHDLVCAAQEMMWIYFYYLKKIVKNSSTEWALKGGFENGF